MVVVKVRKVAAIKNHTFDPCYKSYFNKICSFNPGDRKKSPCRKFHPRIYGISLLIWTTYFAINSTRDDGHLSFRDEDYHFIKTIRSEAVELPSLIFYLAVFKLIHFKKCKCVLILLA